MIQNLQSINAIGIATRKVDLTTEVLCSIDSNLFSIDGNLTSFE